MYLCTVLILLLGCTGGNPVLDSALANTESGSPVVTVVTVDDSQNIESDATMAWDNMPFDDE